MDRLILSLDIGSSSCKAVLFNEQGEQLGTGRGTYPLYYSHDHTHVEQEPEEIWNGVVEAIRQLHRLPLAMSHIRALSLSAQISSHFLIDSNNHPLMPVITWMDARAQMEADDMKSSFTAEQLAELLGAELHTGPSWPIPKIKWISKHRPEWLAQAKYIVQPKEWVLWKLTSAWKSDVSSLRGLVHQASGIGCEPLLRWAGADARIIPPMDHPYGIGGILSAHTAATLQLSANIPVIVGWNDLNAAVLASVGLQTGNHGFDITGTSEHIGVTTRKGEREHPLPRGRGINSIPLLHRHQMTYGVTSTGGQALKWYVEQIHSIDSLHPDYDDVMQQANTVAPGSNGVLFLPYINGERSPWWNPSARGVFFGLHALHDRRMMARAVLEGVGFALRTIYDRLGTAPITIRGSGRVSQIPLWNQIKADIIGIPFVQLASSETGSLGAAILAAYGLGWYRSLEEACSAMIRTGDLFEPCRSNQAVYEEKYALFLRLYQSLEPLFEQALPR